MNPVSPKPARVCLIGISGYGRVHLELLREQYERGAVEITAVVVINPDQESTAIAELTQRGARIYADYEEMLRAHAGALDLCLIPTGIPWHARMTIAALRAGANVLVEKPLAGSNRDVAAIHEEEKKAGRFVAVGFQDFYATEAFQLKRELLAGLIGPLRAVSFLGLWPRDTSYFERNNWAGRLCVDQVSVLDSPMNNALAHFVNLGLFFAGPTLERSASAQHVEAELLRAHQIESYDTSVVRAATRTGTALWFGCSHACEQTQEPEVRIEGAAGQVEWFHEQRCVVRFPDGTTREQRLPDSGKMRRTMLAAVLARLRDSSTQICDIQVAREHTALVEAVHQAATIVPVPAKAIQWRPLANSAGLVPCIRGLEPAMRKAFADRKLLREIGFNLSSSPNPVATAADSGA
jgi:predicted dehydrogenase